MVVWLLYSFVQQLIFLSASTFLLLSLDDGNNDDDNDNVVFSYQKREREDELDIISGCAWLCANVIVVNNMKEEELCGL